MNAKTGARAGRVQQERALRTRQTLLRAAAEVFDEFGFAGASVSKIMKRSGLTQGAMYFHFESKEDLARAVMHAQPDTITPHVTSKGLQKLVDITLVWSRRLQDDVLLRAGVRLTGEQNNFGVHDATPYQEWARIMEDCLVAARDTGELRDGVDPHAVAGFVVSACTGMQMYSWVATDRADLPERTVQMWKVLLPGIATQGTAVGIEASARHANDLMR